MYDHTTPPAGGRPGASRVLASAASFTLALSLGLAAGIPAQALAAAGGPPTLERTLEEMQPRSVLPGYCVAVVDGGGVRYAKGFGYADVAARRPYTPDTVQPVASISKPVLGVALMQQVQAGALSLDADVDSALPFAVRNPHFASEAITLRQLATHSSSIVDREPFYTQSYAKGTPAAFDLKGVLQAYLDPKGANYQDANFIKARPGSAYRYSHLGTALAALAVETKAGMPYRTYTREKIFTPLDMPGTGWSPADTEGPQATLYDKDKKPLGPYAFPAYAASGLYSTCSDVGKFLAAMIRGYQGRPGVLSPASFQAMFAPQWPKAKQPKGVRAGDGLDQGLFWQRTERGELGHTGGDHGLTVQMAFNPVTSTGRVLITNIGDGGRPDVTRELDRIWQAMGKYEQNPEP